MALQPPGVGQNYWPLVGHFNWPLTFASFLIFSYLFLLGAIHFYLLGQGVAEIISCRSAIGALHVHGRQRLPAQLDESNHDGAGFDNASRSNFLRI
jgi:hypothetical protein